MTWYFNRDLKPQGPHSLQDMRNKIIRGEISPGDLVSNEEDGRWEMAIEWKEFEKSLFPAFQAVSQESLTQEWVLLREVQEGPYSVRQIQDMLQGQLIGFHHFVWKPGLSGWVQIKDRAEFIQMHGDATL